MDLTKEHLLEKTSNGKDVLIRIYGEDARQSAEAHVKGHTYGFRNPDYIDNNPSCFLYIGKNKEWFFKDHGNGSETGKNWFNAFIDYKNLQFASYPDQLKACFDFMNIQCSSVSSVKTHETEWIDNTESLAVGVIRWEARESLSDKELCFMCGSICEKEQYRNKALEVAETLNWVSCKYIERVVKTEDGSKIVRDFCNDYYMVFIRTCEVEDSEPFYKIYIPHPDTHIDKKTKKELPGNRFLYYGEKKADYTNGLIEAKLKLEKLQKEDSNKNKLDKITICCGERDSFCAALYGSNPVWFNSETQKISSSVIKDLFEIAEEVYFIPDVDSTGVKSGTNIAKNFPEIKTIWIDKFFSGDRLNDRNKLCKDFRDFVEQYPHPSDIKNLYQWGKKAQWWEKKKDNKGKYIYTVSPDRLSYFLNLYGFYRYKEHDLDTDTFIKIDGCIVTEVSKRDIITFIVDWCNNSVGSIQPEGIRNLARKIKETDIDCIDRKEIKFVNSGTDWQIIPCKNCIVKVSASEVITYSYSNPPSDYYVWKDKVLTKTFNRTKNYVPMHEINYSTVEGKSKITDVKINYLPDYSYITRSNVQGVIINTSRLHWNNEIVGFDNDFEKIEEYRYNNRFRLDSPFLSEDRKLEQKICYAAKVFGIGYLLHSFKLKQRALAVMFLDNKIDEDGKCNGRSGKSFIGEFITKCFSKTRKYIDGKQYATEKFPFDGTTSKTDIIFADDMPESFNIRDFYTAITGDMYVNIKHKSAITLSFEQSPKILISSNYSVRDIDNPSTSGRLQLEVCSDYYHGSDNEDNEEYKISSDFNDMQLLGSDYPESMWNEDINFGIDCLVSYFQMISSFNKIDPPMENVLKRADLKIMNQMFLQWAEGYFEGREEIRNGSSVEKEKEDRKIDWFISVEKAYNSACKEIKKETLSKHLFTKKLKAYAHYKGYDYNPSWLCKNQRFNVGNNVFYILLQENEDIARKNYIEFKEILKSLS